MGGGGRIALELPHQSRKLLGDESDVTYETLDALVGDVVGWVLMKWRTVRIEISITVLHEVPADWDKEMIEFFLNESSSCASNLMGDIQKQLEKDGCLCMSTNCVYKGER